MSEEITETGEEEGSTYVVDISQTEATLSPVEKRIRRAKKFGMSSPTGIIDKKMMRAKRFNIEANLTDEEKFKMRRERFNIEEEEGEKPEVAKLKEERKGGRRGRGRGRGRQAVRGRNRGGKTASGNTQEKGAATTGIRGKGQVRGRAKNKNLPIGKAKSKKWSKKMTAPQKGKVITAKLGGETQTKEDTEMKMKRAERFKDFL